MFFMRQRIAEMMAEVRLMDDLGAMCRRLSDSWAKQADDYDRQASALRKNVAELDGATTPAQARRGT